jgi:hypothetical protein
MSAKKNEPLISFWSARGGVTRIQTRLPEIARELRRLKQTVQVGQSDFGEYLILFDSTQRAAKLRRTLDRIERRFRGAFSPKSDSPVGRATALENCRNIIAAEEQEAA